MFLFAMDAKKPDKSTKTNEYVISHCRFLCDLSHDLTYDFECDKRVIRLNKEKNGHDGDDHYVYAAQSFVFTLMMLFCSTNKQKEEASHFMAKSILSFI
jgi:hypothetical protein